MFKDSVLGLTLTINATTVDFLNIYYSDPATLHGFYLGFGPQK